MLNTLVTNHQAVRLKAVRPQPPTLRTEPTRSTRSVAGADRLEAPAGPVFFVHLLRVAILRGNLSAALPPGARSWCSWC